MSRDPVYRTRRPDWSVAPPPHPAEPEEPRSERPIETEQIRGPGADFGPSLLLIGVALFILLVVLL